MFAAIARPKDACPSPASVATLPASVGTGRRTHRLALMLPLALALSAALAAAMLAALAPSPALAGTSLDARCDGVVLRSKPASSAHREGRLPQDARVVATRVVRGTRWHTQCEGASDSGRTWYRVVSVNGTSAQKLYGRKAVYGAKSLFSVVYRPLEATCGGVRLRTDSRTTATLKAKLPAGTRAIASGTVTGGKWTAECGGRISGSSWYRITRIGDRSVSSLYGVKALYAARGLWRAIAVEVPPPPETSGFIEGIDVSHWQGVISWPDVAAAGKRFAFMKASEGVKYVDPTYATNRAQANANGLKVGAYHFAKPDTDVNDATIEADHFVDTAQWSSGDLLPVLDLEITGGMSVAKLQTWVRTFLDRVYARTGERAMIYTSPAFWKNNMGDTQTFAAAGYRTLWIAHWTTAAIPTVPAANWGGSGWTFWQYTSDGTVAGITGRVDLDRYRFADFGRVSVR